MKDLVITSLATYRLTKLVIDDEILREPREVVLSRLYASDSALAQKAAYLLTCPWCVSIWAAGGLLLLKVVSPGAYALIARALAASAVTGVLSEKI